MIVAQVTAKLLNSEMGTRIVTDPRAVKMLFPLRVKREAACKMQMDVRKQFPVRVIIELDDRIH